MLGGVIRCCKQSKIEIRKTLLVEKTWSVNKVKILQNENVPTVFKGRYKLKSYFP